QLSGLGDEVRELLETKGLRQFQAIASIALVSFDPGIAAAYFYVGPKFAPLANSLGKASYQRQQFSRAEWYFHLASWLDPHFGKPHYNLGWICNQIRNDIPCARAKYQSAVAMGEPAAYAELARIYIMYDRDLPAALKVVEEGLN
ncbi:MAG: hypothetical protein HC925_06560, partial [Coleofasciculaceae cyanobacterium SM2_3_26]|nr:hypothetical protein [Coleofasciculaceae cyanobacterium SM2_3_26]